MTPLFYLGNYLKPADKWNAELNGYWNGKTPLGQGLISPMWSVSMAVSEVYRDKGTIRLFLNDIVCSRYLRAKLSMHGAACPLQKKEKRLPIELVFRITNCNAVRKDKDSIRKKRESNESKRIKL